MNAMTLSAVASIAVIAILSYFLFGVRALRAWRDQRITGLLEANNREVERRREAQRRATDLEIQFLLLGIERNCLARRLDAQGGFAVGDAVEVRSTAPYALDWYDVTGLRVCAVHLKSDGTIDISTTDEMSTGETQGWNPDHLRYVIRK